MFKIFGSTYAKADLEQVVAYSIQLNSESITLLLSCYEDSEDFFDATLVN